MTTTVQRPGQVCLKQQYRLRSNPIRTYVLYRTDAKSSVPGSIIHVGQRVGQSERRNLHRFLD